MDDASPPKLTRMNLCEVQSALLFRAAIYGTACSLYFAITLICTQAMSQPERGIIETMLKSAEDVSYWLPGFLLLIPIAMHDLSKFSANITRPIYGLQNELQSLMADQSERPLTANKNDYWFDLINSYNQVRGELLQLRKRVGEDVDLPPSLLVDDEADEPTEILRVSPSQIVGIEASESGVAMDSESDGDTDDIEDTLKLDAPPIMPIAPAILPEQTVAS